MRKEHYIVREKEQGLKKPGQDGQPLAEFWFKLGPRAYVECVVGSFVVVLVCWWMVGVGGG